MHEGYSITSVIFLPKMHNVESHHAEVSGKPQLRDIREIADLHSSKMLVLSKTKAEKLTVPG